MRIWLSLAIMLLAQPLVFFARAQLFPGTLQSTPITLEMLVLATLIAAAALLASGWQRDMKVMAGIFYLVFAACSFPLVGLMAACSIGDCI